MAMPNFLNSLEEKRLLRVLEQLIKYISLILKSKTSLNICLVTAIRKKRRANL
ncbi:MAG: hypothetical protein ACI94Y_000603 [Maribacter sp.]|jgi:hypothetical protein